jgi:hypothetical protein
MTDHLPPALTRRAFSAHWTFGPLLTALLERRQQDLRAQGNEAAAAVLARMMASAVVSLARELDRGRPDYIRPTLAAVFWRYPSLRRRLQKQHATRKRSRRLAGSCGTR